MRQSYRTAIPTHRNVFLRVLLCLILVSFFGVLAISASMFPHGYDWRYRVISNLLSPRDNPQHYRIAAIGLAVTGLLMIPFAIHLNRSLRVASMLAARIASGALLLGIGALIADCFVVPQHLHATLGIRRFHEFLARSSAGLIALSMLVSCWCAWKARNRPLFWIWVSVTVLPLGGVICSEALLLASRFVPRLSHPIRHAFRHSFFWHLGFWEWTGAVAVFVFLCASTFLLPGEATYKEQGARWGKAER
jgi:hypothetical membrane protein